MRKEQVQVLARNQRVVLLLLVVLILGTWVQVAVPKENRPGTDIYYPYLEGQKIAQGGNPYTRILTGDMRVNQKYPTYFPLFYLLSALSQRLGLVEFSQWLAFWRWVFLAFNVATGALIFLLLNRRSLLLAVFGGLFWFLNRWNLQSTQVANFDYIPIFCLLFSLWLLPRQKLASYLVFSLSLALKQIATFMVPIYLIYAWQTAGQFRLRETLRAFAAIVSLPVVFSVPFLLWRNASLAANAEGVARSILFSVTRDATGHIQAPSVDSLFGLYGLVARVPMFAMVALAYAAFWFRKIGLYASGLLLMAVLVDFNSVIFLQYFCWLVPFVLLVLLELWPIPAHADCLRAAR